jgi:CRISPR/Cas system CSM-associated protein Csm4 (group 5 of RAMP superfamily)
MTRLYRLKLRPTAPWRTPWQADTLAGMMLATAARTLGQQTLRARLIDPMIEGRPPFVLSDAMPGDLLPVPVHLRLSVWPGDTDLKRVKRARWLAPDHFQSARSGGCPAADALLSDADVFHDQARQHNSLSRVTDASFSAEEGGGIYQRPETVLLATRPSDEQANCLSVYVRILDRAIADLLIELFHQLSLTGFGADTATGRGQFELPEDPAPVPHLDELPPGANGIVSLSTFQPGAADPVNGYWDAFPKFGKVGPDAGLTDVRKNTLILFRPGASFRADPSTGVLGRAVPMRELLPAGAAEELAARDFNIIHAAFALTVPAVVPGD